MASVEETRYKNLLRLIGEHGGQARLAEKIHKSPAQISQWKNRAPNSKTGKPRNIGSATAREIEYFLDKPDGWMDVPHVREPEPPIYESNAYVTKVRGAKVSAGDGSIAFEHEEVDGSHAFKRSWLRQKGINSVSRCRMVEVEGESMSPYLEHGDIVLVNMDDTAVKDGQVYVVALDGELLVKRLFKQIDGGVELRSDNPSPRYVPRHVSGEQLELLRILGRVVWRGG